MTIGPSVGDATSGGPASTAGAQQLARGGYESPAAQELGGEPSFTINGQQVPLSELQRGYLRQADYTQKTQALAAQRAQYDAASQLAEALQADPLGTLQVLARETGVDLREAIGGAGELGQQQNGNDPYGQQGLDPNDPLHQELAQLREIVTGLQGRFDQAGEQEANAWLDAQMSKVDEIAQRFGIEYDPDAVYEHAYSNGIDDPVAAFLAMNQDALLQGQPQQGPQVPAGMERFLSEGAPQAPDPARQLAKQQVAFQAPRSGINQGAVPTAEPEPQSFAEAAAQAMRQLGVTDWSQVSHEDSQPGVYVPGQ